MFPRFWIEPRVVWKGRKVGVFINTKFAVDSRFSFWFSEVFCLRQQFSLEISLICEAWHYNEDLWAVILECLMLCKFLILWHSKNQECVCFRCFKWQSSEMVYRIFDKSFLIKNWNRKRWGTGDFWINFAVGKCV